MYRYGSWAYPLLTISEYLSLTFLPRYGCKFVDSLNLLRYISLRWGVVFPLPEKITTWVFKISSPPVIIYLYVLLATILFPV